MKSWMDENVEDATGDPDVPLGKTMVHHGEAKALEQDSKLRLQGRARLQKRGGLGAGETNKAWTLAHVTPGSGRAEQGEA